MNFKLLLLTGLIFSLGTAADEVNKKQIEDTLTSYIEGTSFNYPNKVLQVFAPEASLFLDHKDKLIWEVSPKEYTSWFKKVAKGTHNGRIGEILLIDIENNTATAKVEIIVPEKRQRYVDLFLLKKLNNTWKVLSKIATSELANNSGDRVLFIVSNAHFHGDSELPAGVSFSEIVKAYDKFKLAGFTVDFVSPKGGAIPLSYINTSDSIHKQYLYNSDFMYAIGNTKTPEQIEPRNYKAVHYVGGNNAMYQVAENVAIQNISMEIYEVHGGILSSVCHGTAGIVNLKTKDGKYLVDGKRISGYPEAYENQSKAYFKEFPFLIQETIEARGGEFVHSLRNTPHLEVDGRIITGQNHLSSAIVAEKMIELMTQ
jgi:putative intracellular protease/amidase